MNKDILNNSDKEFGMLYVLTDKKFRVYVLEADFENPYKNVDKNFDI